MMMIIFQGLELAADCHLARITQTAHLLQVIQHCQKSITIRLWIESGCKWVSWSGSGSRKARIPSPKELKKRTRFPSQELKASWMWV